MGIGSAPSAELIPPGACGRVVGGHPDLEPSVVVLEVLGVELREDRGELLGRELALRGP